MGLLTKITISHKEYPLFMPRFEPRTSGMRNSDNSTAFMNYALSVLSAYPKRNLQCTFELINGLSCINIPSDLKYFSLRNICRLTHALKPTFRKKKQWNYIRTGLALSVQWPAMGWKPVVRYPILKSVNYIGFAGHEVSYPVGTGDSFQVCKGSGSEALHLRHSVLTLVNTWSYTSTAHHVPIKRCQVTGRN
jgi:hypothetical protein